jgi:hypothetical protein
VVIACSVFADVYADATPEREGIGGEGTVVAVAEDKPHNALIPYLLAIAGRYNHLLV